MGNSFGIIPKILIVSNKYCPLWEREVYSSTAVSTKHCVNIVAGKHRSYYLLTLDRSCRLALRAMMLRSSGKGLENGNLALVGSVLFMVLYGEENAKSYTIRSAIAHDT